MPLRKQLAEARQKKIEKQKEVKKEKEVEQKKVEDKPRSVPGPNAPRNTSAVHSFTLESSIKEYSKRGELRQQAMRKRSALTLILTLTPTPNLKP